MLQHKLKTQLPWKAVKINTRHYEAIDFQRRSDGKIDRQNIKVKRCDGLVTVLPAVIENKFGTLNITYYRENET